MGEDREIGASVLAGVRAARPPSPEEPRCSVRRVSAGRGHLTRRGQAWSDGNGGRARSLAALARGALARLPSLRCASRATCAAVPPPASRAAGACARWVACVRVPLRLVVIALKYPIVAKYVVADM